MPELPEVETVRRDVERAVVGRRVVGTAVSGARTIRRHGSPDALIAAAGGHRLARAGRHGKYLLLRFDGGAVVVVHLGMSGQLLEADPRAPLQAHTHVVWRFDSGPELRFVDPRTFGEVFVATPSGGRVGLAELDHLGPDALDPALTPAALAGILTRTTKLKPLLLDQRAVAGIGNIYADEILWASRLSPERPALTLRRAQVGRLHTAITATLTEAVAHRGSSLADEQYRGLDGGAGAYQLMHRAYGRAGEPCPRCGRPIRRLRAYGRSTFYCARCQR